MALPPASGPISLRPASIAGELAIELEVLGRRIVLRSDRPDELRIAVDRAVVAAEVAVVGGRDDVGDVAVEEVVLELAERVPAPRCSRRSATEPSKMSFIASRLTEDSELSG